MSHSLPPRFAALQAHADRLAQTPLTALFADDESRAERFTLSAAGLTLCFAKQRIDSDALKGLQALAEQCGMAERVQQLFAGDPVNLTEGRAALHMALRASAGEAWFADGVPVADDVVAVRERFLDFAEGVRSGAIATADGERFTDIVNIGIGGSDLGPRMVCAALSAVSDGPRVHFIANVDAAERLQVLAGCTPSRTLVIIASKTFTTQETMANARSVRQWLVDGVGEAGVGQHLVAVSSNVPAARDFGIDETRVFGFWDWVGGRYSLWASVGLSIALAIGRAGFEALLAGAHAMDRHFRETPIAQNLPMMMALIGVWNRNALGAQSQVVIPYAQRLYHFPGWLQQLEMESNGKSVDRAGRQVGWPTTPALWGDVGTNAQHAFFQMLHQGPQAHPVDFILPLAGDHDDAEQQRLLVANCLAQSAALMRGRNEAEVVAKLEAAGMDAEQARQAAGHRVFSGDRPSSTLLLPRLDARHLGALLAAYEHRTFAQSVLWDINPFDQWGVELGKHLAGDVDKALCGADGIDLDADTRQLIQRALNQHR